MERRDTLLDGEWAETLIHLDDEYRSKTGAFEIIAHNDLDPYCSCPCCLAGYVEHGILRCPEKENEMLKREFIEEFQEQARQAYERVDGIDAMQALQTVMLAEIALQMRAQNDLLGRIAATLKSLDDNSIVTQKQ